MNILRRFFSASSLLLLALIALPLPAPAQATHTAAILHAPEAGKLLPGAVYFDGQSAATQLRNSAGVRFADGSRVLAVLVDNSGYSTSTQQKFQGYLFAEVPLEIGGHPLLAGAYGIGFVGNYVVVMDIGNHDLLQAAAVRDQQMRRPLPLQIQEGPSAGVYQLCLGRHCIDFRRPR